MPLSPCKTFRASASRLACLRNRSQHNTLAQHGCASCGARLSSKRVIAPLAQHRLTRVAALVRGDMQRRLGIEASLQSVLADYLARGQGSAQRCHRQSTRRPVDTKHPAGPRRQLRMLPGRRVETAWAGVGCGPTRVRVPSLRLKRPNLAPAVCSKVAELGQISRLRWKRLRNPATGFSSRPGPSPNSGERTGHGRPSSRCARCNAQGRPPSPMTMSVSAVARF